MQTYARPSRKLRTLWSEWIDLHSMLSRAEGKDIPKLAAPFFSAVSRARSKSKVMLVGKATAGDWFMSEYKASLRNSKDVVIRNRLARSLDFALGGEGKSPFWRLFDRLAKFDTKQSRESVIWSNVAKIGCQKGNPDGLLLSVQADLAQRTLQAEFEEYDPKVVIFVTGTNHHTDRIICRTVGVQPDVWLRGKRTPESKNVWWIHQKMPVIWTRHPQGASGAEIRFWEQKLKELGRLKVMRD